MPIPRWKLEGKAGAPEPEPTVISPPKPQIPGFIQDIKKGITPFERKLIESGKAKPVVTPKPKVTPPPEPTPTIEPTRAPEPTTSPERFLEWAATQTDVPSISAGKPVVTTFRPPVPKAPPKPAPTHLYKPPVSALEKGISVLEEAKHGDIGTIALRTFLESQLSQRNRQRLARDVRGKNIDENTQAFRNLVQTSIEKYSPSSTQLKTDVTKLLTDANYNRGNFHLYRRSGVNIGGEQVGADTYSYEQFVEKVIEYQQKQINKQITDTVRANQKIFEYGDLKALGVGDELLSVLGSTTPERREDLDAALRNLIANPPPEVPPGTVGPVAETPAQIRFNKAYQEAFDDLSYSQKEEFNIEYLDWETVPIRDRPNYPGYSKLRGKKTDDEILSDALNYAKQHPDEQILLVPEAQHLAWAKGWYTTKFNPNATMSYNEIMKYYGGDKSAIKTKTALNSFKRSVAQDLYYTPAEVAAGTKEAFYKFAGAGPGQAAAAHFVQFGMGGAQMLAAPVTIGEAIGSFATGGRGPTPVSSFLGREQAKLGPSGGISTVMGEGISRVTTGEGTGQIEEFAKYPSLGIAGTAGEFFGLITGAQVFKFAKAKGVKYILKPTLRGAFKVGRKAFEKLGRPFAFRTVPIRYSKIMQRAKQWGAKEGYEVGRAIPKAKTKFFKKAPSGVEVEKGVTIYGRTTKFAGRGKRIWMSPKEIKAFKARLHAKTSAWQRITPSRKGVTTRTVYEAEKVTKPVSRLGRAKIVERYGSKEIISFKKAPVSIKYPKPKFHVTKGYEKFMEHQRLMYRARSEIQRGIAPRKRLLTAWEKSKLTPAERAKLGDYWGKGLKPEPPVNIYLRSGSPYWMKQYESLIRKGYFYKGKPTYKFLMKETPWLKSIKAGVTTKFKFPSVTIKGPKVELIHHIKGVKGKLYIPHKKFIKPTLKAKIPKIIKRQVVTPEDISGMYAKDISAGLLPKVPKIKPEMYIRAKPSLKPPGKVAWQTRKVMEGMGTLRVPVSEIGSISALQAGTMMLGVGLLQEPKIEQAQLPELKPIRGIRHEQMQLIVPKYEEMLDIIHKPEVIKIPPVTETETPFAPTIPTTHIPFKPLFKFPTFIPEKEKKKKPYLDGKRKWKKGYKEREYKISAFKFPKKGTGEPFKWM